MKKLYFLLSMLMLLAISIPSAWAADAATMTAGTNGSACKVNEENGIKVGTSSKGGDMSITVPAGATVLHLYSAAWKGVSGLSLNISGATVSPTSISLTADDGITSNSPFTLSGNASSYRFDITLSSITSETTITFTSSAAKRFVVWGATYEGESGGGSDPVAVTGVSLDKSEISLEVGETQTLTATVAPADATNNSVTWTSNNENVAKVSNAGVVTAAGVGNATITVTTADGNKTATCNVEVAAASPKSSLTFTAKCNGSGTADDGAKWTITSDGTESNFDNTKGIHYGTSSAAVGWVQLLTSDIHGTIKKVVVNASGASGTSATISVKVGTTDFNIYEDKTSSPISATATDFEFTGSASGQILVLISQTSAKKAIYCKSIVVSYESDGKESAGLAYADADLSKLVKLGDAFTAPTLTNPNSLAVTYASDNTTVAEVTSNGAVTIKAVGKAVITASSEETENYKAGSASYTIYVTAHVGTEADPYTVADARLAIDCGAGVTGVYATGIVSKIVTAYNAQYGNITYDFSTDGQTTSDQLQAFRGKAKDGANFTSADDVKVGDEVVVKGDLTKYNSTYEFAADNQLFSLTRNKEDAGLVYAMTEIEKNVDDAAFTNALTNPHSLAVTYSSSAEAVATVDANGVVTIVGMGTTTITASFAGDASYITGEASYILSVNDPSLTKVTFDATIDKGDSPLSKSNITLSCSNGVLNNGNEYRLYKNSTTTFACSAGNITMIEFIGVSGNPASGFAAPAEGNFVTDGNNATWTGNATSVSFEASGAQVRATKIFVSYKEDSRAEAGLEYETEEVEKVVGDEPFTNALTNPNSLNVSFTSSDESVAEVAENGQVTIKAEGTTTISAVFEGNEIYKPATVSYTLTVATPVAPFDGDYFVKVTSANDLASGEYLIVYADGLLAFNGALETLDAVGNTISVVFDHGKIQGTNEVLAALFTLDVTEGTIQSASGMYIGQTSDANGLASSAETTYTNTISFDEEGNANIISSGGAYLRYNSASNQTRFRYYKSSSYTSQQAIQLYKKESPKPDYTRSITAGQFGTICLPNGGTIEGATIFEIAHTKEGKIFFDEVSEATMVAGRPYIFYPNNGASELKVYYTDSKNAAAGNYNGLYGSYEQTALAQNGENYILYNNMYYLVNSTAYVGANRAYIKLGEVPTEEQAPAPGRRRVSMDVQGEQVATSIINAYYGDQPMKVMIDNQLYIIRAGQMFDMTGNKIK